MAENPKIPIICGPTGSGKTAAAVELAAQFPIEIVNADSRQIIRHLDIGTAKPSPEERRRAVFHLIDIIEPGESYSAVRFVSDATRVIKEILARGNKPLVVGGTGLYLRALTEGIVEIETADLAIREKLEADLGRLGPDKMYDRLMEIDPLEAAKVHPNNAIRVLRALEIHALTGKTKSELMATGIYRSSGYEFSYFAIQPPREQLYATIDIRVDAMIAGRLVSEVEWLISQGLSEGIRRANVIGYNEILDYLEGKYGLAEAIAMIKQNSRRYAKRQLTWFRHQADCAVFNEPSELIVSITKSYR